MWPTHIIHVFLPFPPTPSKAENDCIFFKGHYCLLIMKVLTSALSPSFFRKTCSPVLFPNWGNSAKPSPWLLYFSASMFFLQKLIPPPRCLPGAPVVKNPPTNAGDMGSIPGFGRSPGEGKGNACHYSCLANLMDRGAWQATVPGVTKTVRNDSATKQQTTAIQLGPFYSFLPHHHFIPLRLSLSRDTGVTRMAWAAG